MPRGACGWHALVPCVLSAGCCAAQLGDRPRLDANLGNFESFNEHFYGSYIKEDFGAARCLPAGSRGCAKVKHCKIYACHAMHVLCRC